VTPIDKVLKVLDHSVQAADRLPGVDVHVDDPAVKTEEVIGTDGVTDIFVFDVGVPTTNIALLRNFDPGEDYILFKNMGGRDLTVGDLDHDNFNLVLFPGGQESDNIIVFGVPYQQDPIKALVLPFDGHLVSFLI
jgi:hypothetical protein